MFLSLNELSVVKKRKVIFLFYKGGRGGGGGGGRRGVGRASAANAGNISFCRMLFLL